MNYHMKKILLLLVATCSVLVMLAQSEFQVSNIRKISATQGGFTGQLDASDGFARFTPIGDIDGDGNEDMAVGCALDDDGKTDAGAVWILFLNQDRTVKSHQKISSTQSGFTGSLHAENLFGISVCPVGDMDSNGVPDIAVGAYYDSDDDYKSGAVYILMLNADGTVKKHQKISKTQGGLQNLTSNSFFGSGLCSIGDLDQNGVMDIVVGAPQYGNCDEGGVWVLFLNQDGTVKSQNIITQGTPNMPINLSCSDRFGSATANIGDLDGDGIDELAVNAWGDYSPSGEYGGFHIIFLNRNGSVRKAQFISKNIGNYTGALASGEHFGYHATAIGDHDQDGVNDIAIGIPKSNTYGSFQGTFQILHMNADGTVKNYSILNSPELKNMLNDGDHLGWYLNTFKTGGNELIVSALYDDDGASNAGALYIMDLGAAPAKPIANAGANQTICGNETATINGSNSTNPTGSALAYAWSSANYTISTPNAASFTFTPQASSTTTTYAFVLTVNSGDVVSDPDTVFVTVNPVPSRPTLSSSNDKIQSNVTASTYNWFLNNEPISNANSNPLTTKAPGNYHLIVSNEFGCASSKSNTITVQDISGLSVSRTELLMKATAGSFGSVKITTNLAWTATCDQDWLTMNANSATGTSTLIFTAAANDAETNRIAIVTVSAEGVDPVTITITQLAKPFLQASQNSVSLENTVGSLATIDVLSNANWKATTSNDWLTVSPTGYNGNATLSISALANNQLQNRNGIVILTATGADTVRIEVIQAPGTPFLSASETELTFEADSTIAGIQIQSNTTWTATTTANWLTFSKNEGSETDSLEFALEYNPASTDREAIVSIQANGVESVTVRIIQKARAILSASTDSLAFEHAAGQLLSFEISSNIDWNLSADQNWIVCNKKTGNGNSEISISNLANTTTKERTGTITITGLNVQPVTITVVQQAMPYSKVDLQTVYIDKEKNSLRGIEIETNQLWTASTTSEWLTVNTLNGVGSGIISLQTSEANPNPHQRSAIVTITMADATTINVTVIQRPTHILSISASHLTVNAAKGSKAIVPVICSTDWTAVSNQSWLSVSALSGTGDNTFEFTAAENTSFESRFATVIISTTEVYSDTVFIEQLGAIRMLSANKNEIQLDSTANSTGQIEIESNVTWTATTTATWLSVSPSSKLGNQTITITAQGNRASVQRSAIITIAGEGTEPVTITVTQAAGKGTGVDDLDQNTISMYPNPTRNGFKVSGVKGNSVLSISDVNGRRMLSQVVSDNEFVNTSNLRNGMYVVQITSNGIVYNQKLIIR